MELRRLHKLMALAVVAAVLTVVFCGCNPAAQPENPTGGTEIAPTQGNQPSSDTEATEPTQEDPTIQTDPNVGIWEDPTDPTQGNENPTQPTQSGEDATQPTQGEEDPTEPTQDSGNTGDTEEMTFAKYNAMSNEEKQAFCESFPSLAEFLDWYKQAEAEYNAATEPPIVIGPGDSIDIGDYIGGNG